MMDRYLRLDKNQRLPFIMTLHLLACRKCRTQVRLLSLAEKVAAGPLKIPVPLDDTTITAVLKQIGTTYPATRNPISLEKWIVSGILMIVFLLIFGVITNNASSQELLIAFYLMFAVLVTGYCALFIGCNMDFFVKKIETFKSGPYEHSGFLVH